jgi:hypothetical protein
MRALLGPFTSRFEGLRDALGPGDAPRRLGQGLSRYGEGLVLEVARRKQLAVGADQNPDCSPRATQGNYTSTLISIRGGPLTPARAMASFSSGSSAKA